MGGLNRHLAQILLFLGAVAVLLPFLHLGSSNVSPRHREVAHAFAGVGPLGGFDDVRVLVAD